MMERFLKSQIDGIYKKINFNFRNIMKIISLKNKFVDTLTSKYKVSKKNS